MFAWEIFARSAEGAGTSAQGFLKRRIIKWNVSHSFDSAKSIWRPKLLERVSRKRLRNLTVGEIALDESIFH